MEIDNEKLGEAVLATGDLETYTDFLKDDYYSLIENLIQFYHNWHEEYDDALAYAKTFIEEFLKQAEAEEDKEYVYKCNVFLDKLDVLLESEKAVLKQLDNIAKHKSFSWDTIMRGLNDFAAYQSVARVLQIICETTYEKYEQDNTNQGQG